MVRTIALKRQSLANIASQLINQPKLARSAASLAKQFKPTVADTLRRTGDLARWLYVYKMPVLALQVCQVLNDLTFENDYNRWTWVEGTLALEWKLRMQAGELERAQTCAATLRETYILGSAADQMVKAKALKNRLEGCLLRTSEIARAEQFGDKSSEQAWRFVEIGELLYMQALGGYETWPMLLLEQQLSLDLNKIQARIKV